MNPEQAVEAIRAASLALGARYVTCLVTDDGRACVTVAVDSDYEAHQMAAALELTLASADGGGGRWLEGYARTETGSITVTGPHTALAAQVQP